MIARVESYTRDDVSREIEGVWLSDTEAEAFAKAAEIRRILPRGDGWKVRTNERSVDARHIKVHVWVVTAEQEGEDLP
jgi:DICT domain-containing protein